MYVCMYVPTLPAMRTARGAPLIRWVCSGSRKGLVRVGFRCRRVGRLAEASRTLPLLLLHYYCCTTTAAAEPCVFLTTASPPEPASQTSQPSQLEIQRALAAVGAGFLSPSCPSAGPLEGEEKEKSEERREKKNLRRSLLRPPKPVRLTHFSVGHFFSIFFSSSFFAMQAVSWGE
jgi:hypothetical protein